MGVGVQWFRANPYSVLGLEFRVWGFTRSLGIVAKDFGSLVSALAYFKLRLRGAGFLFCKTLGYQGVW